MVYLPYTWYTISFQEQAIYSRLERGSMIISMVEKYSKFRWTSVICIVCFMVTFSLYLLMQTSTKDKAPYGTTISHLQPVEIPKSNGLYTNSDYIDELNDYTLTLVQRSKAPTVILYYASWCGHCRWELYFCHLLQ